MVHLQDELNDPGTRQAQPTAATNLLLIAAARFYGMEVGRVNEDGRGILEVFRPRAID